METLKPASLLSSSSYWLVQEANTSSSSEWTKEENKRFESALAIYDEKTPDRWHKVADLTGKSVREVIKQYSKLEEDVSEIEAGLVPFPGYLSTSNSFTLEWVDDCSFDGFRKKSSGARPLDHERRKGVPWTEDEHKRFLLGLQKHGKGDWRSISRNYVISKTPTQVASHAQKYFLRKNSIGKDKRRPSIHDITTENLTDDILGTELKPQEMIDQSTAFSLERKSAVMPEMVLEWNHPNDETLLAFNSTTENELLMLSQSEILSALKLQGQNLYNNTYQKAFIGSN